MIGGTLYMRKAVFHIFLLISVGQTCGGIIEHTEQRELPSLGKTVYMFGEVHTDPFDNEAVAQRQALTRSVDTILSSHQKPFSCYLECDSNLQKDLQQSSYCYLRNVSHKGAFFEQWYVRLARCHGNEVKKGQLCFSSFDIRDTQYAEFESDLRALAEKEINRDDVDFQALRLWAESFVDSQLQGLFSDLEKAYPQEMISYISRDMERKKKQFYRMIDTQVQAKKRTRYGYRALENFYNYTDLLADFTILNKLAHDSREAIIIHAGSAHTENLSRYFNYIKSTGTNFRPGTILQSI
jgi:hypothetical protein